MLSGSAIFKHGLLTDNFKYIPKNFICKYTQLKQCGHVREIYKSNSYKKNFYMNEI